MKFSNISEDEEEIYAKMEKLATLVVMMGSNCVNLGFQNVPASSNLIIIHF